jgi:hypothetical protein
VTDFKKILTFLFVILCGGLLTITALIILEVGRRYTLLQKKMDILDELDRQFNG